MPNLTHPATAAPATPQPDPGRDSHHHPQPEQAVGNAVVLSLLLGVLRDDLRHGLVEALTAFTDAGGEPRWSARDETPEWARDRAEVD